MRCSQTKRIQDPVIAQVYTKYDAVSHPYLRALSAQLKSKGGNVKVFSRLPPENKHEDVIVLDRQSPTEEFLNYARRPMQVMPAVRECMSRIRDQGFRKGVRSWLDLGGLRRVHPDAVHLMNWTLYFLLRDYLRATGVPFVVSFRGYETLYAPHEVAMWTKYLNEVYQDASVLHFVSEFLANAAIQQGAPRNKVRVIYPGIDLSEFLPRKEVSDERVLRLVSTCRLTWEKGLELALLVVKQVAERIGAVEYHIIGEGSSGTAVRKWAGQLGLGDRVVFHGAQPSERVREIVAGCQIYFHPAVSEALGIALVEASAMGKPVVATRVEGIPEVIADGESGILLEFGDVYGLADAIVGLWRDPNLRRRMGGKGRAHVERLFSVEREAEDWLSVYGELAPRTGLGNAMNVNKGKDLSCNGLQ